MFTKTIGKKCPDNGCRLSGQLQDTGLVICPDCGTDLVLETVSNQRAQAAAVVALVLLGAITGGIGYGFVAKSLSPVETAEWLARRIQLGDSLVPAEAKTWIDGGATFFNDADKLPLEQDQFLYRVRDGRRTSTFRAPLASNTTMRVEVTSVAPGVSSFYVFHRGDRGGRLLHASAGAPITLPLAIPGSDQLIRLDGAAGTEHFVLVAAKKPLPAMARLVGSATDAVDGARHVMMPASDVDAAIVPLESDPDAFVLHVFIPHS